MAAVDPGTGLPRDLESRDVQDMLDGLGRNWWILLFLGVISLGVGLLALFWPSKTALVVAVLFGIWLIISGIFQITQSFAQGLPGGARALLVISGVLSILLGLFALKAQFQNATWLLAIFIGIGFLFRGVMTLVIGIDGKGQAGRGWNIFAGIILILGGVVVIVWPEPSLSLLVWIVGIWLVVLGLFEIYGAFKVKALGDKVRTQAGMSR